MNQNQQKILKGVIAAIVATTVLPPFVVGLPNGSEIGLGYGFILSWPHMGDRKEVVGHVDVPLLLAEWLAIAIVGALLWVLFDDKRWK